jgi:hypothetical protein
MTVPDVYQVPFVNFMCENEYCSATSPCENKVLLFAFQSGANFAQEEFAAEMGGRVTCDLAIILGGQFLIKRLTVKQLCAVF